MDPEARKRYLVLITVIVGTFLGRIDQTIVNLALPKIIEDFSISVSAAAWIATAYILANAVFVPVWGKLGDTIGRKKVYIMGFAIFILGSVLAGFSWNLGSMIVFRIIQAVASSADYPTAMAILTVTFPPGKARAQALGVWTASFAAASVFGPLIGGPLIDNFGWRSVFMINLPVGIIGLLMAINFIRESVSERKSVSFDWWGAATLGTALSTLVLVLDQGQGWGWLSANSLMCYVTTVIFGAIFYFVEKRHVDPIVDFRFFKNSVFVGTMVNNFLMFMGFMGTIFLIPLFCQTFLGLTATQSGYVFIPMAFMFVLSSPLGGHFIGKVAPRVIIFWSTLGAGLALLLFSLLDPRSSVWLVVIALAIMAFFAGLGMPQRTGIIAAIVPVQEIGIASSLLALARNIAGAFGVAVFSTLLEATTNHNVLAIARRSVIQGTNALVHAQAASLIILKAEVNAYDTVYVVGCCVLILGAVLALTIKLHRDATHSGPQEGISAHGKAGAEENGHEMLAAAEI
jgi:EmrB/QacA subfamily drug resistance transporter